MSRNPRVFGGAAAASGVPTVGGDFWLDTLNGRVSQSVPDGAGNFQWQETFPPSPVTAGGGAGPGLLAFGVTTENTVTAGGGGAADDVQVFNANFPRELRLVAAWMVVGAAVVGSSVQLRTAPGGAGLPVSGPIDCAAVGRNAEGTGGALGAPANVAQGASLWLRRSDSAVGGTLVCLWSTT